MVYSDDKREVWLVENSNQLVVGVHPENSCKGLCTIHKPSDHPMRKLRLSYDLVERAFTRTCKHGNLHQDPDERVYWTNKTLSKNDSTAKIAREKLSAWACPLCECGCCDITKL